MRQHHRATAALLVVLFLWQDFGSQLLAQSAPLTQQQLDQLLSPIALYPDSLLSQMMTASTTPQQILDVDNWLYTNPGLSGTELTDAAEQKEFDPAFIALVNFPQVLEMMAQHIDDYAAIGEAFTNDQGTVTDSIQRLRAQAYAAGSLRSNAQQTVEVQQASSQTVYLIQPANPQVVYVPQYDPTVVYISPRGAVAAAPLITFGAGITIGALLVNQPWGWNGWAWNWRARRVYYNNVVWGGWGRPYRPPRPWYRPRPIVWMNRPGYGGNWHYRPRNYRPPRPGNHPSYGKPPYGPANRPGYRPSRPNPAPPRPNPNPPRPNPNPSNPGRPSGTSSGGRPPAQSTSNPNPPRGGNRPTQQRDSSQPNPMPPRPNSQRPNPNPSNPGRPSGTSSGGRPPAQSPSESNPPGRGNRRTQPSKPTPSQKPQAEPAAKPAQKPAPEPTAQSAPQPQ